MKLSELLKLIPENQSVEIFLNGVMLYEGNVGYFDCNEDYEVDEIMSYGDISNYDRVYSVICIDCKEMDLDDK